MSRPAWQAPAEAVYAALLHLYPRRIREHHGEEMRQAFRDRCREVSTGNISAWQLLCLEIVPDFATTFSGAHMEQPTTTRARTSLLVLALLVGLWLCQGALSPFVLDGWFRLTARWHHWREERAFVHDESLVRSLADRLVASPREADRALAAYLYTINYASRGYATTYAIGGNIPFAALAEDGERANRILASLSNTADVASARTAVSACLARAGCDRLARAQALVRLEPRNAYGWSQLLKIHTKNGDESAAREDLSMIANSTYYQDGQLAADRALVAAALRSAPGDAATLGALGRQLLGASPMLTDDLADHVFIRCALSPPGAPYEVRWLQQHPEAHADCRGAAQVFAKSESAWESRWGWSWLDRDEPTEQTRTGKRMAEERMKALGNLGGTPLGGHRGWRPWTDAEWLDWAQAQQPAN